MALKGSLYRKYKKGSKRTKKPKKEKGKWDHIPKWKRNCAIIVLLILTIVSALWLLVSSKQLIEGISETHYIEESSAYPIEELKELIQESVDENITKASGSTMFDYYMDISVPDSIKGFETMHLLGYDEDPSATCSFGRMQGQNINYLYCNSLLGLKKDIVSPDGVILKKLYCGIVMGVRFVLDNNFKVIEVSC